MRHKGRQRGDGVVQMRRKQLTLTDIQADPERHLEFMSTPTATVGDLLQEISDLTGMSYRELAPHFGYSYSHFGRLVRGREHQQSPDACAQVARATCIPFKRIVYASAIGALTDERRRELVEQEEEISEQRRRNVFYREIVLMSDSFDDVASVEDLRAEIDRHATTQEHTRWLPHLGDSHLLLQMTHKHMQYQPEPGRDAYMPPRGSSIPLDAIVEVELLDAADLVEDGEVVLVQIKGETATLYEYEAVRNSRRKIAYEIYHAYDRVDGVTRVVRNAPGDNKPASDVRRILGRVVRIVDAGVGAVSAT